MTVICRGFTPAPTRLTPTVYPAQQMMAKSTRRSPRKLAALNWTPRAVTTSATPAVASTTPAQVAAPARSMPNSVARSATTTGRLATIIELLVADVIERPVMKTLW